MAYVIVRELAIQAGSGDVAAARGYFDGSGFTADKSRAQAYGSQVEAQGVRAVCCNPATDTIEQDGDAIAYTADMLDRIDLGSADVLPPQHEVTLPDALRALAARLEAAPPGLDLMLIGQGQALLAVAAARLDPGDGVHGAAEAFQAAARELVP